MTNSARLILHSRAPVAPEHKFTVAKRMSGRDRTGRDAHGTFIALEGSDIMELTAFDSLEALADVLADRTDIERAVASRLTGEWRHEILGHVEDLMPGEASITTAPMVEMRHIEVPPPLYGEYRDWREATIYKTVGGRQEIDDFRSYQSVLSTTPGVMFIVGFSAELARYRTVYQQPAYQDILKQAGSRYIAGGPSGLDCRTYARPDVAAALEGAGR